MIRGVLLGLPGRLRPFVIASNGARQVRGLRLSALIFA
jgi:hypothetical protein